MGTGKKAIFYPTAETEVSPYYDNANTRLLGTPTQPSLALKYGITVAAMGVITTHKNTIPAKINKATADSDISQESNQQKDTEMDLAKVDLLRIFKQIENASNFDEADAEALGFRKIKTPVDLNTVKPVISKTTVLPDMVILDWVKASLDGVLIFGSYNGTTFTQIGTDAKSPFEDVRPNQTPGTPETRWYKMRYIKNDSPVGLESEIAKVVKD